MDNKFFKFRDAYELMCGYNREEAQVLFKLYAQNKDYKDLSLLEKALIHWGIAYCNGADYNMNGPAYSNLRISNAWPSLNQAKFHSKKAKELYSVDDIWGKIFECTLFRFENNIKSYSQQMELVWGRYEYFEHT